MSETCLSPSMAFSRSSVKLGAPLGSGQDSEAPPRDVGSFPLAGGTPSDVGTFLAAGSGALCPGGLAVWLV